MEGYVIQRKLGDTNEDTTGIFSGNAKKTVRRSKLLLGSALAVYCVLGVAGFSGAALAAADADAEQQESSGSGRSGSLLLDNIYVTAQKREQDSQDVGIAITTFSGDQIEQLGFENSTEIANFSPGVSLSGSFAGQQRQFSIRGVTQNDFNDHVEAPNAVYIDEGYVAMQQGQIFATFDMDRVEILKGPQGTLFGRNATGGLIHYVTRQPTDEYEGFFDATYGAYNQVRMEGAFGGPITDRVRFRVAGLFNRYDGYLENHYPEETYTTGDVPLNNPALPDPPGAGADLGGDETWALRAHFEADIGDNSNLLITPFYTETTASVGPYQNAAVISHFQYLRDENGDIVKDANGKEQVVHVNTTRLTGDEPYAAYEALLVDDMTAYDLDVEGGFDTNPGFRPCAGCDVFAYKDPDGNGFITSSNYAFAKLNTYQTYGATARFKSEYDNVTFTSVSDLKHHEKFTGLDFESGPENQYNWFGSPDIDSFTQELRLNGETDRLRWVAGFYYLNIKAESITGLTALDNSIFKVAETEPVLDDNSQPVVDADGKPETREVTDADGNTVYIPDPFELPRIADLSTDSYSLFGQAEYDFTDTLTLIAGLRLTKEIKDFEFEVRNVIITPGENNPFAWELGTKKGVDYTVVAEYAGDTNETLITARAQLNWTPTSDLLVYASFNRGAKAGSFNAFGSGGLPDDEVPYDAEVIYAYEAGIKSDVFDGLARINAAAYYYDYRDYQASRWTGLSNVITNNDAEILGFDLEIITSPVENLEILATLGYVDATVKDVEVYTGTLRDVRPTFAPEWTAAGLARYTIPEVAGGDLAIQGAISYQSGIYHNLNNFDANRFDGWKVVDFNVSWRDEDYGLVLDAFVKNAFDERYNIIGFDVSQSCGCNEEAQGKPRWWGVSVRKSF